MHDLQRQAWVHGSIDSEETLRMEPLLLLVHHALGVLPLSYSFDNLIRVTFMTNHIWLETLRPVCETEKAISFMSHLVLVDGLAAEVSPALGPCLIRWRPPLALHA